MNEVVRLLHTSDWHLGAPDRWWGGRQPNAATWDERLRTLREAAIRSIVDLAIRNRVDAVLVAGDVLDQPKLPVETESRTAQFLATEVIAPLRDHRVRLVLTPGTHDWNAHNPSRDASLRVLRRLAEEHPQTVVLLMPSGLPGSRSVDVGQFSIATERPNSGSAKPWIELLHTTRNRKEATRCVGATETSTFCGWTAGDDDTIRGLRSHEQRRLMEPVPGLGTSFW